LPAQGFEPSNNEHFKRTPRTLDILVDIRKKCRSKPNDSSFRTSIRKGLFIVFDLISKITKKKKNFKQA
jgi:hypothetical protein